MPFRIKRAPNELIMGATFIIVFIYIIRSAYDFITIIPNSHLAVTVESVNIHSFMKIYIILTFILVSIIGHHYRIY
jgi:hypothetical protein